MRVSAKPLLAVALLLATACGGKSAPAPATSAQSLLWTVDGPEGHGWLLGTMHVSAPRALALAPAAEAAFEQAAILYTEIEGGLAATAFVQQAGSLPPGKRLVDVLPPDLHRRLVGYLESRRLSAREFERFRPWMATMMLAQIDALELLRHGPPLDEVLRQRSRDSGKRLGAVETVQEQIAALSVGTEEQHVHLLSLALDKLEQDLAAGRNRLQELFETWLRGDERELLRLQAEEMELSDPAQLLGWDALFLQRNRVMAERVDRYLRNSGGEPPMFAFGSMHFMGPDSVVALLRARGWKVERVIVR
mgnify:CR=1 FL=1